MPSISSTFAGKQTGTTLEFEIDILGSLYLNIAIFFLLFFKEMQCLLLFQTREQEVSNLFQKSQFYTLFFIRRLVIKLIQVASTCMKIHETTFFSLKLFPVISAGPQKYKHPVLYAVGLQATFWNMNSSVWAILAVLAVREKKWI